MPKPFKIIIAGSRDFNDYKLLKYKLDRLLINKSFVHIISGTARGADQLGERYAAEHDLIVEYYPAEWDKFGKSAGYRRNEEMAKDADALVAFNKHPDGTKGTNHMINLAKQYNLAIRVVKFR